VGLKFENHRRFNNIPLIEGLMTTRLSMLLALETTPSAFGCHPFTCEGELPEARCSDRFLDKPESEVFRIPLFSKRGGAKRRGVSFNLKHSDHKNPNSDVHNPFNPLIRRRAVQTSSSPPFPTGKTDLKIHTSNHRRCRTNLRCAGGTNGCR
jgi:hypothetical protein